MICVLDSSMTRSTSRRAMPLLTGGSETAEFYHRSLSISIATLLLKERLQDILRWRTRTLHQDSYRHLRLCSLQGFPMLGNGRIATELEQRAHLPVTRSLIDAVFSSSLCKVLRPGVTGTGV